MADSKKRKKKNTPSPVERFEKARAGAKKAAKGGKRWLKNAKAVTDEDVHRVVEHGVDKAEELLESAQGWVVKLGLQAKLLYDMLVAWWMGRFDFPKASVAAIVGALLYFINPFDLIPDFLPVIGYVDEAVVFAFVAKMVQSDMKRYTKKFGIKSSASGL